MQLNELIYDWNLVGDEPRPTHAVEFDDETLRDGLQSPSVIDPPIEKKVELLHLMEALGINSADIGLPGAGPRARRDVLTLACEIARNSMQIRPNCAARTVISDIIPIAEVSQEAGIPIEVAAFIGSSPIRQYAEEWTLDKMLKATEETGRFCLQHNLPFFYVTEDTTRAHPDTLRRLYKTAIEAGATRICVADTVGHATPTGAKAIIRFVKQLVAETGESVKVDWHGHQDRGLGVINSIAAYEAGADRIHGAALGVGERVGNTPMDQLLVNFQLLGYINRDLTSLRKYCEVASASVGIPIPPNYPVVGRDAFRTATGVHAAAVVKAFRKNDEMLANLVYSSVPANLFGFEQIIDIGPMSGKSNVVFWLERHGIEPTEERVDKIFAAAKQSAHVLTVEEVMQHV